MPTVHIFSCIFTTYAGIITNVQRDQLPDWFIARLVEQVGHGFESRSSLNQFFQAIILQLLKLCVVKGDDQ